MRKRRRAEMDAAAPSQGPSTPRSGPSSLTDPTSPLSFPLPLYAHRRPQPDATGWHPLDPRNLSVAGPQRPTELRVLTYNVFAASPFYRPSQRLPAVLRILRSLCRPEPTDPLGGAHRQDQRKDAADVVCLQEVTAAFCSKLCDEPVVRQAWAVTAFEDAQAAFKASASGEPGRGRSIEAPMDGEAENGVMLLVRKSLLSPFSTTVRAMPFLSSRRAKGLLVLDLLLPSPTPTSPTVRLRSPNCPPSTSSTSPFRPEKLVRIATAHYDALPENRRIRLECFNLTADILSRPAPGSPTLSVLAADFNHSSYGELSPLVGAGFLDIEYLRSPPLPTGRPSGSPSTAPLRRGPPPLDPFRSIPTFGHLFPFIPIASHRLLPPYPDGTPRLPPPSTLPHRKPRRNDVVFVSSPSHTALPAAAEDPASVVDRVVSDVVRVGADAVRWQGGKMKGRWVQEEQGRTGRLWPSDHEGILVTFRL